MLVIKDKQILTPHVARKPTTVCLWLVVLCVCFLIWNLTPPQEWKDGSDGISNSGASLDDATMFNYVTLLCLLSRDAFRIVKKILQNALLRMLKLFKKDTRLLMVLAIVCALALLGICFGPPLVLFWPQFASRVTESIEIVERSNTRRFSHISTPYSIHSSGPFCIGRQQVYNTEDVTFDCKIEFYLPDHVHYFLVLTWSTTTKRQIVSSPGTTQFGTEIKPKSEYESKLKHTMHFVRLHLFFQRITDDDFGIYSCSAVLRITTPIKPRATKYIIPPLIDTFEHKFTIATFHLLRLETSTRDVYLPPGGILHLVTSHWTEEEEYDQGEILVERKVNGQSLTSLHEEGKHFCSASVITYSQLLDRRLLRKKTKHTEHTQFYKLLGFPFIHDVLSVCVGPALYGVHTAHVRRFFYNKETKTEDFVEGQDPLIVRLAPSYPGFFGSVSENADTSFFAECWKNDQPVVSEFCSLRAQQIKDDLRRHFLRYNFLYGVTFFSLPISFVWSMYKIVQRILRFVYEGSFCVPVMDTLCLVPVDWTQFSTVIRKKSSYDVFLSYDLNERQQALGVQSILERYGLRVYNCHETPKPGQATLVSWDRAIDQSRSFVILASCDYVSNPELHLQFRAIHHRVLSHEIPEERMLIVSTGHCDIPRNLGPLPIVSYYGGFQAARVIVWWAIHVARNCSDNESAWQEAKRNLQRDFNHLVFYSQWHKSAIITALKAVCPRMFSRPRNNQQVARQQSNDETHQNEHPTPSITSRSQSSREEDTPCEDPASGGVQPFPLGGPGFCPSGDVLDYDVFLTYCEDSPSDCDLASQVKERLERVGLRVFDAVLDVLGYEVEQEGIAAAVSRSASFVVLLSPAFRSHPLTRRLHFPQILHAVNMGRVSSDSVLLIRTGYGTSQILKSTSQALSTTDKSLTQQSTPNHERERDDSARSTSDARLQIAYDSTNAHDVQTVVSALEAEHGEEHFQLHDGLRMFTTISWTGGLADEDYMRQVDQWGKRTLRHVRRRRRRGCEREQQRYRIERFPRPKPVTLSYSYRFLSA
ncbi:hypothetical protein BaRGS_00018918 [Batillaria attramentaria]|uniref:TIR domain-containing protein n=1 Tax=Batillaria attramentaria TaxID=370345 RepID=A0ABD0KRG8_9CAEN